jgi:hypothetical protein
VPPDAPDPTVVHTVAVTVDDVVAAFEANRQTGAETVLRVTPPFSGRMRARLHRTDVAPGAGREGGPEPGSEPASEPGDEPTVGTGDEPTAGTANEGHVHVRPADLLAEDAPAYPHPDETADALRADPDAEYTRERHRERHEAAVATWREAVREHLVDRAPLRTPGGTHDVDVVALG